jgi:hypothetical protein
MVEISTTHRGLSRSRTSRHINRKPASNLYHAVRIAQTSGTPLNYLVTFNFGLTDCPPDYESEVFEALRADYFGPWIRRPPRALKRRRDPCAYVWVLENHGGCVHLHWAVHIPKDRISDFKSRLELWIPQLGLNIHSPNALQLKRAHKPLLLAYYLLKGINPPYADFYGVKFHSPQGIIVGKRSGFSRSLGPTMKSRLRAAGRYTRRPYVKWPIVPSP